MYLGRENTMGAGLLFGGAYLNPEKVGRNNGQVARPKAKKGQYSTSS